MDATILIAHNHEQSRCALVRFCSSFGMRVATAAHGLERLARAAGIQTAVRIIAREILRREDVP